MFPENVHTAPAERLNGKEGSQRPTIVRKYMKLNIIGICRGGGVLTKKPSTGRDGKLMELHIFLIALI